MAFLRMVARSVALIGIGAAWLQAQTSHAHVIVAPQGRPRVATIAPPPPAPGLFTYGETVFQSYPYPVLVTPDGRILVDLGDGYEQVARTCPYAYGYGCQSYAYPIASQTPLFSTYYVPEYSAPRYASPTYGIPYYPTPQYPSGGYGYYYQPPVVYGGCPVGYMATGSYPPCIDPYRPSVTSVASPAPETFRASPRRPSSVTQARPVHR